MVRRRMRIAAEPKIGLASAEPKQKTGGSCRPFLLSLRDLLFLFARSAAFARRSRACRGGGRAPRSRGFCGRARRQRRPGGRSRFASGGLRQALVRLRAARPLVAARLWRSLALRRRLRRGGADVAIVTADTGRVTPRFRPGAFAAIATVLLRAAIPGRLGVAPIIRLVGSSTFLLARSRT
jgi:hypothetical protein